MFSLTESQILDFQKKGWLGPLDTFSLVEIEPIKEYLKAQGQLVKIDGQLLIEFDNPFLGYKTTREHHLSCKPLAQLLKDDRIVGRLNQLGEPNLLLWRTNIFYKLPGQKGINWHQAVDYYGHEIAEEIEPEKKTLLFPAHENVLDLTIWLAIEDSTLENGCLYFANGTHKQKFKAVKVPANEGAFSALTNEKMSWQKAKLYSKVFEFNETEYEIQAVPAKAGQIIIFTEKVIHSSPPNQSNHPRVGINARYIRPSVKIYPHRCQGNYIDGTGNNIERHFSILVSGRDDNQINICGDI